MAEYISLTAIGKDKHGLVSAITKVVYEEKCNIEDSTMTILQGQFAMILIIKLNAKTTAKSFFGKLQRSLEFLGLSFYYKEIAYSPRERMLMNPFVISVYGLDKTGIVYNISQYLAENKINIVDMRTTFSQNKGKNAYIMIIESNFPKNVSYKTISQGLANLAKSLNVTISINRAESSDI